MKFTILKIMLVSTCLVLSGCISLSTFQVAQTMEEGNFCVSGGAVGFVEDGDSGIFPEIGIRYGLSDRSDFGIKLLPPLILFADYKYELIEGPLTISMDMGISVFRSEDYKSTAFYPMILAGRENWYVGLKKVYAMYDGTAQIFGSHEYSEDLWFPLTFVIGGSFGEHVKLLPEINFFAPTEDGDMGIMPGLGVEFHF